MIDINELRQSLGAVTPEEVEKLLDRLEAAESETASWKGLATQFGQEADALRAKIAKMEQQELARLVTPTAYRWRYRGAIKWQHGELTEEAARLAKEHNHEVQPLYALPGAQPAPSVPDGWKLVPIEPTHEMVQRACSDNGYPCGDRNVYVRGYRSMLAAAPKPEAKP